MRRLRRGTAALLLFGAAAIKLRQDDLARLEAATGHAVEDLTEEQLLAAMKKLGINRLELDAGDRAAISEAATDEDQEE